MHAAILISIQYTIQGAIDIVHMRCFPHEMMKDSARKSNVVANANIRPVSPTTTHTKANVFIWIWKRMNMITIILGWSGRYVQGIRCTLYELRSGEARFPHRSMKPMSQWGSSCFYARSLHINSFDSGSSLPGAPARACVCAVLWMKQFRIMVLKPNLFKLNNINTM